MEWYDGRDTIHVKVNATETDTDWRGVGFYSRGLFANPANVLSATYNLLTMGSLFLEK